jgi:hypothetical protein
MQIDRAVVEQALEALETLVPTKGPSICNSARDALRAALAQQDEPLNLRDPAVQKRLATQWGYVPAAQAEPVEPVATLTAQRDDILRMAREACETTSWKPGLGNEHVVEFMARFAALVTAAEREACAKVCEEQKRKYEERAAKPQNIRDISPEVARIAGIACDFDAAAIRARTP